MADTVCVRPNAANPTLFFPHPPRFTPSFSQYAGPGGSDVTLMVSPGFTRVNTNQPMRVLEDYNSMIYGARMCAVCGVL